MHDQTRDPSHVEAWGDVVMPAEAQQRQAQLDAIAAHGEDAAQPPAGVPSAGASVGGAALTASHRHAQRGGQAHGGSQLDYSPPSAGPGGEAMQDGSSPAPRGYTGGAMGKFVAGLSSSFAAAASGMPPPGGAALYTRAEDATTFGPEPPSARTPSTEPTEPPEPTGTPPPPTA